MSLRVPEIFSLVPRWAKRHFVTLPIGLLTIYLCVQWTRQDDESLVYRTREYGPENYIQRPECSAQGVRFVNDFLLDDDNNDTDESQENPEPEIGDEEIRSNTHDCSPDDERCKSLSHSGQRSVASQWHRVLKNSTSLYVFSAYLDRRTRAIQIRFLCAGDFQRIRRVKLYCQLRYGKEPRLLSTNTLISTARDNYYLPYVTTFFKCTIPHLPKDTSNLLVSLSNSKFGTPTHYLPLNILDTKSQPDYLFTVCMSPLHYQDPTADIYSFVETVEMNRILGADKIVLYNYTTGPKLSEYIHHYVRRGVVDVVPWRIPLKVFDQNDYPQMMPEMHNFGQVLALNDCLYRYMYRTQYIVFTDLDELIVPRGSTSTWTEMMQKLTQYARHGAFTFRHTVFNIDWPDDDEYDHTTDQELQLRTQLKLMRQSKPSQLDSDAKMIVIPRDVVKTGSHLVVNFLDGTVGHNNVQEGFGLLHHYRLWGGSRDPNNSVRDTTMTGYAVELRERVKRVHHYLGNDV